MPRNANRRRRQIRDERVRAPGSHESRAAEVLTVGWLLTTFTALVCEVGGVAATWYFERHPQALGIAAMAEVLMFAALLTGIFSLLLLAVVWKLRVLKPPHGLMVFAAVVGLAPAVTMFLKQFLG